MKGGKNSDSLLSTKRTKQAEDEKSTVSDPLLHHDEIREGTCGIPVTLTFSSF